jgi:hypothetical protein
MPDGSAMTLATGRKGDKLTRTVGRVGVTTIAMCVSLPIGSVPSQARNMI